MYNYKDMCNLRFPYMIVSRSQTKTITTKGQPTVLAFFKSLARFLAILVGDKPLIFIIKISILYFPSKPAI